MDHASEWIAPGKTSFLCKNCVVHFHGPGGMVNSLNLRLETTYVPSKSDLLQTAPPASDAQTKVK